MNESKKVALYIRVSTDDQTEYSPDSQIKLCRKYANENNYEILENHIYKEDGISGTKADKRPQFLQMITNAKTNPKPFDAILVYDFSRFARNKDESVMYKTLLRKKLNIDVISITQPLSNGKESIILESMYEAMDEYYSLNLSENVKRGKVEKASRGEHQGNAPFGYIYDKNIKGLIIDEEKKEIVKLIFNEWIKPEQTIRGIVLKLNSLNIKTTRGCSWADRSIHIILRNPIYIGYTRFTEGGMKRNWNHPNTKITKGKHEAIIDIETWELAKNKLKEHDTLWSKNKKPCIKHEHWLRGLVHCSSCGHTLIKTKVYHRAPYFQCGWYTKGRCIDSHHILERNLVDAILNQLKMDFTEKLDITISENSYLENENDIIVLKKQLTKINDKEKRIKLAYEDGIDSLSEYKENKKRLSVEKENIEKEIKKIKNSSTEQNKKNKIYKYCEETYKLLSDEKVDEKLKYEISHRLFDKIIYNHKEKTLSIYYK